MGPGGTLPSSSMPVSIQRVGRSTAMVMVATSLTGSTDHACENTQRDGDEAEEHHDGDGCRGPSHDRVPTTIVGAEGLEDAPRAVVEVQGQSEHGGNIEDHQPPLIEASNHVLVDV